MFQKEVQCTCAKHVNIRLNLYLTKDVIVFDNKTTIFCGDSGEVMKSFPDDCIDLTVTSPPYDGLRTYNGYSFNFELIAQQLFRVTKPGGVVVWVVGDATIKGSETGTSFKQALYFKEIGFNLHDISKEFISFSSF
jgi:DNA modification methylase